MTADWAAALLLLAFAAAVVVTRIARPRWWPPRPKHRLHRTARGRSRITQHARKRKP